jgi:hypothetical protein
MDTPNNLEFIRTAPAALRSTVKRKQFARALT